MFQNRRSFMAAIAIVSALFATSFVGSQATAGNNEPRIEGTLAMISIPEMSIRLKNGTIKSVKVPSTAKVERNGVRVPLSAFMLGDRVQVRYAADAKTIVKFEGTGR